MRQIGHWAGAAVFFVVPLYCTLRFGLRGLFVSVLPLWLTFALLSEFMPLCRPGWEPFHSPTSFVFGLGIYLLPFSLVYSVKRLANAVAQRGTKDDERNG
jgi:hypothetical protein